MADTEALQDLLVLLIDATNDTLAFTEGSQKSAFTAMAKFSNLMGDLMKLAPESPDLVKELQNLSSEDLTSLTSHIADKLDVLGDHAKSIVAAALQMAQHLSADGLDLFKAIKG